MYRVKLSQFEGPLDLLLFFIKRDELDIYDIPIARITKDFLEYMEIIQELDLEAAGDFILMASTLIEIKVRMLLPKEINDKGEEIDPRQDLVAALLDYKRYKEASEAMSELEDSQRLISYRGQLSWDPRDEASDLQTYLKNVSLYDLIKAFHDAMSAPKPAFVHQIIRPPFSLEDQMDYLISKIGQGKMNFLQVIEDMHDKMKIVFTFIAALELVKQGRLGLKETTEYNKFILYAV